MKKLQNMIEYAALLLLFGAFRALTLDAASKIGGLMARAIGPRLRAHNIAQANLAKTFPDMPPDKQKTVLAAMWDNLGRVAAELPHLPGTGLYNRMVISGAENFPENGMAALFFSGHLGNWELLGSVAHRHGVPMTLVYRKANNPHVDKMTTAIRATQATDLFPKGVRGAVKMARAIKNGHSIAMLIDQKMNDGIAVPFFGRDAMTAPAIAELALRYDMPIIPARVLRTKGAHFEATVFQPMAIEKTGDNAKDVLAIMTQINATLESWIREYPEQWFWVHKRWPENS